MCGIAGVVGLSNEHDPNEIAQSFIESLKHRGPDGSSAFIDGTSTVLVHTRLAIIDLSTFGAQPMSTPDSRYTITFNGEIYNYRELKAALSKQGISFQGDSDTEVLLRLYETIGERVVDELKGMFAFAIWDSVERSLFVARDALGIKPLYYQIKNGRFAFASEVRSLIESKLVCPNLDAEALAGYFQFGSVQEPKTLISDVRSLPAGHVLKWQSGEIANREYWYPTYTKVNDCTLERSIEVTRNALLDSVSRHLVSDVPVGIFLSGGLDSTSLLSLAKQIGQTGLRTFCISFEESEYDEGKAAKQIADHYGSKHYEWKLSAFECGSLIEEYFDAVDQPSCDGLNTFCISRFASRCGMKVVLSGLGGDELFGSYPSFTQIPKLVKYHRTAKSLGLVNSRLGWNLLHWGQKLNNRIGSSKNGNRLARISQFLRSDGNYESAYWAMRGFFSHSETSQLLREYCGNIEFLVQIPWIDSHISDLTEEKDIVSFLETTRYMRNQLLRDSDVMSMAHGLELRVPFVDRALFDVVNRIPSKFRHASGKKLLIEAVGDLPKWIRNSKKRGFSFPFEIWFNQNWKTLFDEIQGKTGVSLSSWYRKWSLLSLNKFIEINRIYCND